MQEFTFISEVTEAQEMETFAKGAIELETRGWTFTVQFHVKARPPDIADDFDALKKLQNEYPWRGQWFRT